MICHRSHPNVRHADFDRSLKSQHLTSPADEPLRASGSRFIAIDLNRAKVYVHRTVLSEALRLQKRGQFYQE